MKSKLAEMKKKYLEELDIPENKKRNMGYDPLQRLMYIEVIEFCQSRTGMQDPAPELKKEPANKPEIPEPAKDTDPDVPVKTDEPKTKAPAKKKASAKK